MNWSSANVIDDFLALCAHVEQRVQGIAKTEHLDPDQPETVMRVRDLARLEAYHIAPALADRGPTGIEMGEHVADYVTRSMLYAGPLQPLLDDPRLEEIMVNGPRDIFVIRSGAGHLRYPEGFYDEAHLRRTIERIAAQSLGTNRTLDPSEGIQDISLADGSRLHVVHPELSATGHLLINLRRTAHQIDTNSRSSIHHLLVQALDEGATIVIAGLPGSGKTTLARRLLAEVNPRSRVVVAEEVAETGVALANVAHLQTRRARRGSPAVDLRTLVAAFLRMAPSIAVVGEIRDREALPFLLTTTSGVPGLTTIHARDTRGALTRLRLLAELNGAMLSSGSMSQLIAEGIDIVVYQAKVGDSFFIREISLVEDVAFNQQNTNFVTIELDIGDNRLLAPVPQHARLLRRFPSLSYLARSATMAELA